MTRIGELEEFQENAEKHFGNVGFSKEQTCELVEENMQFYYPLKKDVYYFFCSEHQCLGWFYNKKGKTQPVLNKDGNYSVYVYWDRKEVSEELDDDDETSSVTSCY